MEIKGFTLAPTPAPYAPEEKTSLVDKIVHAAEVVKAAVIHAEEVAVDAVASALHLKDPDWKGEGYNPEGADTETALQKLASKGEGYVYTAEDKALVATVTEVTSEKVVFEETPAILTHFSDEPKAAAETNEVMAKVVEVVADNEVGGETPESSN